MTGARPPTVRAVQLGRELRFLREEKRLTMEEVGAVTGWSAAKLSRIENARTRATIKDVTALLDVYDAAADRRDRLVRLARTARERGWWEAFDGSISESLTTYIGLEDDAVQVDAFTSGAFNGLLQTEDYARAVIATAPRPLPPGVVARRVEVRMRRQARLTGPEPLRLNTVLEEAAVRRRIAGPDVMRAQFRHMAVMGERDNVSVRILPFDRGPYPLSALSFSLMRFPGELRSDVVHLEALSGGAVVETDEEVFLYALMWDRLRELALPEEESRDLLLDLAARF
jgi:transcriptional regulator with XRE-family HTH domain